jgi:hypothetical protein
MERIIKLEAGQTVTINGLELTIHNSGFKAGDVLVGANYQKVIFKEYTNSKTFNSYWNDIQESNYSWGVEFFRIASPKEKEELLEEMHDSGIDFDFEKLEVIPYYWKPKIGERYFTVGAEKVLQYTWENSTPENTLFNYFNVFKTKELTEAALQQRNLLFKTLDHGK